MHKALTAFILEDEANAREALIKMLAEWAPEVEVVGHANTVATGLEGIRQAAPDVLFLDIQLDKELSFDLLQQLNPEDYHIIFVTAYNQFAVEAFDSSALDYLLKPINPIRLQKAVTKVLDARQKADSPERSLAQQELSQLAQLMAQQHINKRRIVLKERDMVHMVSVDNILWCEAKGSYTEFFMAGGQKILVSKHLKEYEGNLQPHGFFRIHRSYMVNLNKIEKVDRSEGNTIYMEGGFQVQVSVRRKEQLLEILQQLS